MMNIYNEGFFLPSKNGDYFFIKNSNYPDIIEYLLNKRKNLFIEYLLGKGVDICLLNDIENLIELMNSSLNYVKSSNVNIIPQSFNNRAYYGVPTTMSTMLCAS